MVNLKPTFFPPSDDHPGGLFLTPNHILHPHHSSPKLGKGLWVTCHRGVMERLQKPGPHMGAIAQIPGLNVYPRILGQVEDQLRQRVLQEALLLRDRLETAPGGSNIATEHRSRLESGVKSVFEKLSDVDASVVRGGSGDVGGRIVALLDMAEDPIVGQSDNALHRAPLVSRSAGPPIPLYRTSTLLPEQRSEIAAVFNAVAGLVKPEPSDPRPAEDIKQSSPSIFALSAYPPAMLQLDTGRVGVHDDPGLVGIPLAVALWRLRCWFGEGWEEFEVDTKGRPI